MNAARPSSATPVGVVAIGRNEGERLIRCLRSAVRDCTAVVYVDSGSDDDSTTAAAQLGAEVVELPRSVAFTAARARNAGFRRLVERWPSVQFVQFVDGDCELVAGWIPFAERALRSAPDVAAVHGRRRERYPDRSIYNELCDLEWQVQPGPIRYFGGDVMVRRVAFEQVGGYRDDLIAGEEPELSVRLRQEGWLLRCLEHEMTLHDAAMTRFRQWWRRMERSGYAFALGTAIHGAPPERHWVRERRRPWVWVVGLLSVFLGSLPWLGTAASGLLLLYPAQWVRIVWRLRGGLRHRALQATAYILSLFPELVGQFRFITDRLSGRVATIIEYK